MEELALDENLADNGVGRMKPAEDSLLRKAAPAPICKDALGGALSFDLEGTARKTRCTPGAFD